jgi:site-specific DNA-methyltransferase (adenine-specific)
MASDPFEPELRHGRWQDVSAGIVADAVICDPPYGGRTHEGTIREQGRSDGHDTRDLVPSYTAWTPEDVLEFVTEWHQFCRGWMVALTSHDLLPAWQEAHESVGRYCFAPVPCVMRGMSVRLCGDGPSSWSVYAVVARPSTKEFATWGTLDGAYHGPRGSESGGGRGKPDWLMQALVRDYSRPGDLIVDPFCGWGSTLIAARALGRRSIGIDIDADALAEARRRIERPTTMEMFA